MKILDGRLVSESRRIALKSQIQAFTAKTGQVPHLVVVLIGQDPASQVYVRNKIKSCEAVGIRSTKIELPESLPSVALEATLKKLMEDPSVDGVLVQLPLPPHLEEKDLANWIVPGKDVDCFSFLSKGQFYSHSGLVQPCTPGGIMSILSHYQIEVSGLNAVVVGRSQIVGQPMAQLLTGANATVTVCHSKTTNLRFWTQQADLVVVAAGTKGLLGKDDFKKGAIVIDVGVHGSGQGGKLEGDVRPEGLETWLSAMTPVPGGVGPMTITTLLENTFRLTQVRRRA